MPSLIALFRILPQLAALVLAVVLVLGFFGRWHPALDSLGNLRAQFAAALILVAPLLLWTAGGLQGLLAAALGIAAIVTTLPKGLLLGSVQAAHEPSSGQPIYSLLQLNPYHSNATPEQVLALIAREKPDVITLQEVSPAWLEKLDLIKRGLYPHQWICQHDKYGVAIVSRRPFAADSQAGCWKRGTMATAIVNFRGVNATIAAIHLGWPWPFNQGRQLDGISNQLASLQAPALLGADLNATPWSFTAERLAKASGMSPVETIGRTWQSFLLPRWLRFAGLQIDHVLRTEGVVIHSVQTLEAVGSDHWPVLVKFSLPAPAEQPPEAVTVQAGGSPQSGG